MAARARRPAGRSPRWSPPGTVLRALLDLVLAPICLGCGGRILASDPERLVCGRCRAVLRRLAPPLCSRCGAPLLQTGRAAAETCPECAAWPPALSLARSGFFLHPPADRLVHQLKYRGWRDLAGPMGELLARAVAPPVLPDTRYAVARAVVPVPTSRARIRQRGYNQAELLADSFARATGRRTVGALSRTGSRGSQTALQPGARRANVAGFFQAGPAAAEVRGEHAILVDDVLTTGATAGECAGVLIDAGALSVTVVTFVRALDARRLLAT